MENLAENDPSVSAEEVAAMVEATESVQKSINAEIEANIGSMSAKDLANVGDASSSLVTGLSDMTSTLTSSCSDPSIANMTASLTALGSSQGSLTASVENSRALGKCIDS